MNRILSLLLAFSLFMMPAPELPVDAGHSLEYTVSLESPDGTIPATVCMPEGEGPFPAVVMLHGTGSNRNEIGDGYKIAAPILADEYDIATIRIDYPGCGDNKADSLTYDYAYAVRAATAAAEYMQALNKIDPKAIGVMGWSQGGTNALLACARRPLLFRSIVTWAGAPDMTILLPEKSYKQAQRNGSFTMKFGWRKNMKFSEKWCEDVMNTDVLGEFGRYSVPVLAIAGTADETVDPDWAQRIVDASENPESDIFYIEGMDHMFNTVSETDVHSLLDAVHGTGEFFTKTLREDIILEEGQ